MTARSYSPFEKLSARPGWLLPLKQGSKLITEPVQKANVQNNQFQSVFTPKEPLTLSRLCTMKVQGMVDEGLLHPESVTAGSLNPTPPMDEFNISVGGGGGGHLKTL